MNRIERLAKGNSPLVIIGAAALGGWLLGSGIFALPGLLPRPHPTSASSSPTPATLPASSAATSPLPTSSASMPQAPVAAADPFAGWNV